MKRTRELLLVVAICAISALLFRGGGLDGANRASGFGLDGFTDKLPAATRSVVLVQFGDDHRLLTWARRELEDLTRVEVRRVTLTLASTTMDAQRRQLDADKILAALERVERGPNEVVIALTKQDIFLSSRPDWRYCFGSHGRYGSVLSSARMGKIRFDGEEDTAPQRNRLRKMLLRYTLESVFDMKRSDDPKSLLYRSILGPQDLDRMELKL